MEACMTTSGFTHRIVLVATLLTIAPAPSARAQSAIAGVVRDSSGGVLPGVSVEAASAALIEGTRTAVTDTAGSYKIESLRPGVYAVTFPLTGFRSVKREGIGLPTSFTATINAELSLGQLQESVTVTGESPLVDVRGSVSQSVMNRERLDTIPTGKDPFAVGQLIAGVTTQTPDVGGTQVMQQNRVQSVYDVNVTLGGPVRRDRLWFFGTFRRWSANNFLGNTFTSTGEQAVDDQHISDATIRFTLQAKKNNKFSFHYDRSIKWRGHRPNNWLTASLNDPISDVVQTTQLNYIGEIKWSSTIGNRLLAEAALFAQDSWRLGRWTLNPGLRYEKYVMSIPAQSAPAGTWTPARDFAAQNGIVNWNTVSPRLGFSWDVFDDGRTAVKGGVSRYDRLEGITIIQPLNQRNISFQTCPWSDTNGDLIAQNSEIVSARCTGSLLPSLGNVDPGLKRPHQWEYTVMVQRQVGGNTSVSVGYYGRRFSDLYTTVNAAVPSSAYTPVTITNPLTNQPLTVYNQDPPTRGLVRNVVA